MTELSPENRTRLQTLVDANERGEERLHPSAAEKYRTQLAGTKSVKDQPDPQPEPEPPHDDYVPDKDKEEKED